MGCVFIGHGYIIPTLTKVSLNPQIEREPVTPYLSLTLLGLTNASNDPTLVDTTINKASVHFLDKSDKRKEETPMLKTGIVDGEKRAISEKKHISIPQEVKAADSSLGQQDKQSHCLKFTVFSGEEPR